MADENGRRDSSHLIDPKRPGYLKRGALLTPREWIEACRQELRGPRGGSLALIEPSPDPFRPKREEAPAKLKDTFTQAEKELEEA